MAPFRIIRACFIIAAIPLVYLAWNESLPWVWPVVLTLTYLTILAVGASRIGWRFFVPSRLSGPKDSRKIALSFDDGPAAYTSDILDILRLESVPAAFFTIGQRAEAAPDVLHRWIDEGHLVGNHSYSHSVGFDMKTARAMEKELEATNTVVETITGLRPRLFRPPFGVTNPALAKAIRRTGMISVGWSLRSFDTRASNAQALTKRIVSQVKGGDVILLHDSMQITATVLTAVIQACREKGFTFVRLDELLALKPYA